MSSAPTPLRPVALPRALVHGYRAARFVSPALAARFARRVFFTPPPARRRPDQTAVLARGERLAVPSRRGLVAAWSWGSGPAVLLVHGWGGHAGQWASFVEPLVTAGFRAIALDAPAHGESAGSVSSVLHFAAAVEAVAERHGPLYAVAGHSFGCAGLTVALERGLAAPRAIFLAPPARFSTFLDRFSQGLGIDGDGRERLRHLGERWLDGPFERFEPRRLAPRMATPLLVVHDAGDDEVSLSEGAELAAGWPGAVLVPTVGLGHYRMLRDRATIERVLTFLGGSDQTAAAANSAG